MTDQERENLETSRRLLAALAAQVTGAELSAFFHEEVVQQELPNRLTPEGATRDRAALLAGAERGRAVTRSQRWEIRSAVARGDLVALEVDWAATLAIPIGKLAAGDEMRAKLAMFIQFREGRIVAQRNYDCFEPF